jgi:hypothetical protein
MPGTDVEPTTPPSQDALVADIERTRAELAQTIDAISGRLNPANAARRTADRIRERVAAVDPALAAGAAVAVVGLAATWFVLRRRRRR